MSTTCVPGATKASGLIQSSPPDPPIQSPTHQSSTIQPNIPHEDSDVVSSISQLRRLRPRGLTARSGFKCRQSGLNQQTTLPQGDRRTDRERPKQR